MYFSDLVRIQILFARAEVSQQTRIYLHNYYDLCMMLSATDRRIQPTLSGVGTLVTQVTTGSHVRRENFGEQGNND